MTAEHPGRTFAVADLLVRASWRRQGIGAALHGLVLATRPEERATLTVAPSAAPAQHAFRAWGWRKVARTRDPAPWLTGGRRSPHPAAARRPAAARHPASAGTPALETHKARRDGSVPSLRASACRSVTG